MLRIQLFGPPAVTENNQPVIIKRRTTRALLFYIAAFQKPVSRDVLVDAFWPDKPLDRARLALADTLSKLRADLNDKTVLLVTPTFVSLNPNVTYVDWLDFCVLKTQIEKTPGAFTPNQSLSVSLYQKMSAAA